MLDVLSEFGNLIVEKYGDPLLTGFGLCVVLHLVKAAVEKQLKRELGMLWYFAAWALGTAAAFVVPHDCVDVGWRCYTQSAISYGAAALLIYPVSKRVQISVQRWLIGRKARK